MTKVHLSFKKISVLLILLLASIVLISSTCHAGLFDFGKKKQGEIGVGSEAPDFSGTNFLTKEKISYYKDLKGKKVVLLDFWSIYCVSCLKEIPKLVEIYNRYDKEDIYFIGVDLDTNTRRLKMFLKDPKKVTPYPIVMDKTRAIANTYNVNILPTTVIIDKSGKIKFYHEGYRAGDEDKIEEVIQKLIN